MASDRRLVTPTGKRKILASVRPNLGVEVAYRKRLDGLIAEMHRSFTWWLGAQWRSNTPILAQDDDSPAMGLRRELDDLGRRWQDRFDEMAEEIARHFAKQATERADGAFQSILKRGGWTVRFRMTDAANQALQATIGANIALIKSIPAEYLNDVQGSVMRGVQTGRDLATITQEIEQNYGVTRRRAALIARDQTNKAGATITRVRQQELGITHAVWLHSHAGKHPRPEHLAFSQGELGGPVYEIAKGAWLDGKWTWPGVEINCRCTSKPIVEGFS